jgi:cardiolipin synthase
MMAPHGTWRSLVSALVWGTRGRRFESGRPDLNNAQGSDRILTIPNVLSLLRLASVPVFIWLFVSGREDAAVILYGIGASSDFFDGVIARRFDQVSELGKLLDPLADRIFIVALCVALVARDALPWWLALAVVARDLLVLSIFPFLDRRKIERIRVNRVGKLATASLLFGLTLMALGETSFSIAEAGEKWGLVFTIVGAALYWVAGGMYAVEARDKLRAAAGV